MDLLPKPHRRLGRHALVFAVCLVCCGCGETGPETAPIEGVVTLGGNPIPSANVSFSPADGFQVQPFTIVADESGHYTGKGEPGEYQVTISAFREVRDAEGNLMGMEQNPDIKIPPRYNTVSPLTATVTAGETNTINFDLEVK